MDPTMHIVNLQKAGEFFISLANDPDQIPDDMEQRKAMLKENGVNVDAYDRVEFCIDRGTTIHFVVRHKAQIAAGEEIARNPEKNYMIHPDADAVYRQFYLNPPTKADIGRKVELFEIRIGDYSVNQCA